MKVSFAAAADGDLEAILDHIKAYDPFAAEKVIRRIQASVALLRNNPKLGKSGWYPGIRELYVARSPYVVFYVLGEDEIGSPRSRTPRATCVARWTSVSGVAGISLEHGPSGV